MIETPLTGPIAGRGDGRLLEVMRSWACGNGRFGGQTASAISSTTHPARPPHKATGQGTLGPLLGHGAAERPTSEDAYWAEVRGGALGLCVTARLPQLELTPLPE